MNWNHDRAESALRAIESRMDSEGSDLPTFLAVDMITDILHLSDRDGWEYTPEDLLRIALSHYETESQ